MKVIGALFGLGVMSSGLLFLYMATLKKWHNFLELFFAYFPGIVFICVPLLCFYYFIVKGEKK